MGAGLLVLGIILSILGILFILGGLFGNTGVLITGFLFSIIGGVIIQIGKQPKKKSEEKVTLQSNQKQAIQTSYTSTPTIPLNETNQNQKQPSEMWWLAPLFLGVLGGIIAYFGVKKDNKKYAIKLLILGLIITIIWSIVFGMLIAKGAESSQPLVQHILDKQQQVQQLQQSQPTNNLIAQDKSQLNDATVNLINVCEMGQSIGDLTGCKTFIADLKNKCQDSQYSSTMSVCSDPRIDQFLSTVDSKIAYAQTQISSADSKLNDAMLKMIDVCSQMNDPNNISTCKTEMMQIQQECNSLGANAVSACNDPRIVQIMNKQITQSSNVYDYASQTMESFINLCIIAQDNNTIQDCATKAKQMISLCQSTSVQACSDPRLQQIANMGQIPPAQ